MSNSMVDILAVLLIFGTGLVAVVGGILLAALKILKGSKREANLGEEAMIVQEIHHGLNRLEERVEALELLLMDKHGPVREPAGKDQ